MPASLEAAARLGYKTMIHEQNSIIGLTNKILVKNVDRIVCCYDKAYETFPKEKTYKLGNPRASVIAKIEPKDIFKNMI
ncbi:glycosyltransferase [Coprobacillaceae bacterium CR2/5/TPMF4]|nr:glycosyltransferase [Coprobacillaceae bacterium CR2/5/TPMF4]